MDLFPEVHTLVVFVTLIFPTKAFGEKADYSGFDHSTWEPHCNSTHRYYAMNYIVFRTPKKGNRKESWLSILYSHLTSL